MKNLISYLVIIATIIFCCNISPAQNTFPATGAAGIGTTTPNASSLLDITSTTKGVLVPRMAKTQRDAITTPATGLLIYQTNNTPGFYYYSGTAWTAISAKGANTSLSNLVATSINQPLLPNADNTLDLGSSSVGWKNVYASGTYFLGGNSFLSNKAGGTFVGASAGISTIAGNNTGIGFNTLYANIVGTQNTAVGSFSLENNTASDNTATGYASLENNTTGYNNTANGALSLAANSIGDFNTACGAQSLYSNTMGSYNAAFGFGSLYTSSSADYNTAFGSQALHYNTTASDNVAVGYGTLYNQSYSNGGASWSTDNVAVGFEALYYNQPTNAGNAKDNSAVGAQALFNNTTGYTNVALGTTSLYANTTGHDNVAVGVEALYDNTTGYSNTGVGRAAGPNSGTYTNCSAFGYDATSTASNQIRIGNFSVVSIGGDVNWSNVSDGRFKKNIREDVKGLEFVNKLLPITYTLDVHGINKYLGKNLPDASNTDEDGITAKEKIVYSGFIAQDVEKAANETGYNFSGVDAPKNESDLYGLRYAEFVVPLVKAVQELSQKNDDLQKQIDELKSTAVNRQSSMDDGLVRAQVSPFGGDLEGALLGQNIPNPFDNSTLIPFRIPKNCHDALIMISNTSTSEVISVIPVSCNEDHISIDAGTIASGTYSYTLYVDGKMADTKEMVITK